MAASHIKSCHAGKWRRVMKKYVCKICGWIYDEALGDPDNGIEPGTKFEDLPEDYICPMCGAPKEEFEVLEE